MWAQQQQLTPVSYCASSTRRILLGCTTTAAGIHANWSSRPAGLCAVIAEMQDDLTVYSSVVSNQRRQLQPLRRYIAQADLSGRFHFYADAQWPTRLGSPVFQHPWFRYPQPLTNVQAPSLSGRYPCLLLLARSMPCPCSS
jgi:hypothetical protein